MRSETRLILDIGTNSSLALLARVYNDKLDIIFDKRATTRLGEGIVSSGTLSGAAMDRTANVIASFVKTADFDKAYLIGTEALRRAANSSEFVDLLKRQTNLTLSIISGESEAELSFLGALYNLSLSQTNILQIDVGGGSTELVTSANGNILRTTSVPIGALKLLESIPDDTEDLYGYYTGRGVDYLMNSLSGLSIPENVSIVATGGTITSAAAIIAGHGEFTPKAIHGKELGRDNLEELAHSFEFAEPETRKELIPFDQERSELILPGLGIFLAFLGIIEQESLIVSTGGLRFGAALYPDKIVPMVY